MKAFYDTEWEKMPGPLKVPDPLADPDIYARIDMRTQLCAIQETNVKNKELVCRPPRKQNICITPFYFACFGRSPD